MAIIKQLDKRTGITYVYDSKSFYDKEKKCSRAKRTLIGKIDPDTGEMIPTDGRNKGAKAKSVTVSPDIDKANRSHSVLKIAYTFFIPGRISDDFTAGP